MCEYTIVFLSKYGCPLSSGMSKGWTIILVLLVGTLVYLTVGIGIKRYKFGLTGMEAVPNIEFWRDLPGLVRDGIVFSTNTGKDIMDKLMNKYSKV